MSRTFEEAIRLGIKVKPAVHRMTRRLRCHNFHWTGTYGITIHIAMDEDGSVERCMLLSEIVGDVRSGVSVKLTDLGRLVEKRLLEIGTHGDDKDVEVEDYVIMPTHVHATFKVKSQLPLKQMKNGKEKQIHLGHIVGYFKSGCTSWFRRWLAGESVEEIFAAPGWNENGIPLSQDIHDAKLWEDNYNSKILGTADRLLHWKDYVAKNAFYWKIQMDYPNLFQHRLHIKIANYDFSAYGCIFLLNRADRIQVMCHRLAYRSMLTAEELEKWAKDEGVRRKLEEYARENKLGRYDRDWWRVNYDCKTPVPYTMTQAFIQQKERLLKECEENEAVLVSPAISAGEKEIFYEALDRGYPCIKLQRAGIPKGGHPVNKDREYCGKGLLLVLGAWEIIAHQITDGNSLWAADGNSLCATEGNSLYSDFHNLNGMAASICGELRSLSVTKDSLRELLH